MPETQLHWHLPKASTKNPLLLLHGFMGSGADWQEVASLLPEHDCYCPDLPGHGASVSENVLALPDIENVANLIKDDLDELGITNGALLGYSMGGRVALHLSLQYPKRFSHVVLESASPGIQEDQDRTKRLLSDCALANRLREMNGNTQEITGFLEEWYAAPIFGTLQSHPELKNLILNRSNVNSEQLATALELMSVGKQKNLWPKLSELNMPTLLIAGAEDRKYRQIIEKMAELNPNFAVQLFSACSHNVHWENPTGYTTAIRAFLSRA